MLTGVRKNEAAKLKWTDIKDDIIESSDKVADKKSIYLTTPLRDLLTRIKDWQDETGKSDYLLPSAMRRALPMNAENLNEVLGRLTD